MNVPSRFKITIIAILLAVCSLYRLAWIQPAFAQFEIGKGKKKTSKSKSKPVAKPTPTPTPTPIRLSTPVALPEIAADPKPRLVGGWVRWEGEPVLPNWLRMEDAMFPPEPPPLIEVFTFKTVILDKRERAKESEKSARLYREYINDDVRLELVEIPGGQFQMGTPENETDSNGDTKAERPLRKVTLQKFWLGQFEVTQEQWRAVADLPKVKINLEDQSAFKGSRNLPAEKITWEEAVEFCARLEKKTGRAYRLPTEAEWEYAARAGTTTPFAFGETLTMSIANYNGEAPFRNTQPKLGGRRKTLPAGSLGKANAFGLFDMHGNVWEWCQDRWHENYSGAPTDGSAWMSGTGAPVIRGGSYEDAAADCRSATRLTYNYSLVRRKDLGFRIAVSNPF